MSRNGDAWRPDPRDFEDFARRGRPAYVAIDNKAEGSAPLSAIELVRCIATLEREPAL